MITRQNESIYRVFYAIPGSGERTLWQDSLQRFDNGHDATEYAKTHPHARVTDENGVVLVMVESSV